MKGSKPFFVREATGLVREIGPLSGLVATTIMISWGEVVALSITVIPSSYPGANVPLSFLIVLPFVLIHCGMLTLMTWSMPRSGGDYVWTARIIHPAVGLATNLSFFIYSAFINGAFISSFVIPYMVPPLFFGVGFATGNSGLIGWSGTFFASITVVIVLSTLIVLYSTLVNVLGLKVLLQQWWVGFVIGVIGLVALSVLFIGVTPTSFAMSFDKTFGTYQTYENMIALSKSNGFSPSPSLSATIASLPFMWWVAYLGYQCSMFWGGELKSVKKTMLWSTFGSVMLTTVVLIGFSYLFITAVGQDWFNAASYLANSNPALLKLPSSSLLTPYGLATALTNSFPLIILINFSLILWGALLVPGLILLYTRILLGMAFDRVLPSKLAYVSDTYHTPTIAIVLSSVVMFIGVLFGVFYTVVLTVLNSALVYTIGLSVGGISAMLFPYVKKQLYSSSPAAKYTVGGLPLVSLLGGISCVFFVFLAFESATNTNITSALSPSALIICLCVFLASGSVYFISRWYRMRKDGFDIAFVFKELPPE